MPDHVTNLVMVYETGPQDNQDQALEGLLRVCRRLLNAWKNYMNVDASAAVSSLALGPSAFEEKLAEATMNLTMKYVMKSQNLFSSLDYSRFSPLEAMARENEFREIIQALKSNNTVSFESARSLLLARIQESPVRQAGLLALYLAYHIAASLVHQLEDTDYVYSTSLLEEISGLKTSQEVCIWTVNFLSDIKRYVQFHYQFDFPDEITRAIDYIDSHYYKPDLTLYEAASEAGEGSAPVIHSAAQVNHPVEQGITGVAEVFLDTFVICTITGLVLGVTGVLDSGAPGNVLAINAFASVWEPLRYVVAVCLLMFSSTTLMSQWYFGFVGLNYIFGTKVADKFKYVFPCFCIIGALAEIELVWVIQDVALGLLTIPNLIAMVALAPQVRKATKEYFGREAGGRG